MSEAKAYVARAISRAPVNLHGQILPTFFVRKMEAREAARRRLRDARRHSASGCARGHGIDPYAGRPRGERRDSSCAAGKLVVASRRREATPEYRILGPPEGPPGPR